MYIWPKQNRGRLAAVIGTAAVLGLAACTSSNTSGSGKPGSQIPWTATQTIYFATAGLGAEGAATNVAIASFEKLHPNITVKILNLSSTSTIAQQQEEKYFLANSATPDVLYTDVIWPPAFARAGWIANLSSFHPNMSGFFAGQAASGEYNGGIYAIPWYINAEGLYYRTDLIKTPPTTIAELVSDAKKAVKTDHSLKEGLAFEGAEAEAAVTAWQSFGAQIGLSSLPNINTAANRNALNFMYDAIHTYKIAPAAVTAWQEPNVADAWTSCQTPFALDWPYLFALSESKTNPCVDGHTGWIPFPNTTPQSSPQSSLGGDDLAINSKSIHQAAAWKFIQYLTSVGAQVTRGIGSGDPPAVKAAYDSKLYAAAPYFRQEAAVYDVVTPRAVTPEWAQISGSYLQPLISSVLSGESTSASALAGAAPTVAQLLATAK
jgi:multiple sugar transport system substrate-binding protein